MSTEPSGPSGRGRPTAGPGTGRPRGPSTGRPGGSASGGYGADAARGMNQASRGLAVAVGFVLVVLLFFGVGRLLDGWIGIEPWGTVVGSVVGWVLGVVVVYYMSLRSLD